MSSINICLTGPRPSKLFGPRIRSDDYTSIRKRLDFILDEVTSRHEKVTAHSGMALGADTIWAELIVEKRRNLPNLKFHADIPHREQSKRWPSAQDRSHYEELLSLADSETLYSEEYTPYCLEQRNRGMIDSSDTLVAVWGGTLTSRSGTSNAIRYYLRRRTAPFYVVRPTDHLLRLDLPNPSILKKTGHLPFSQLRESAKSTKETLSSEGYELRTSGSGQMIAKRGSDTTLVEVVKEVQSSHYEIYTIKHYRREGVTFVNFRNETFIREGSER